LPAQTIEFYDYVQIGVEAEVLSSSTHSKV
jgi:hypothetical protein